MVLAGTSWVLTGVVVATIKGVVTWLRARVLYTMQSAHAVHFLIFVSIRSVNQIHGVKISQK